MFEHQFNHEVVDLESKFFWLPLAQQTTSNEFIALQQLCFTTQDPSRWLLVYIVYPSDKQYTQGVCT